MSPNGPAYPLTALFFKVSWGDSQNTANFSEVSGLTMEREVVEYRGGADLTPYVHKSPGLKKYGNITAKRGIAPAAGGNGLYEWYNPRHRRRTSAATSSSTSATRRGAR